MGLNRMGWNPYNNAAGGGGGGVEFVMTKKIKNKKMDESFILLTKWSSYSNLTLLKAYGL